MITNNDTLDTTGYYDPETFEYHESAGLRAFREGGVLVLTDGTWGAPDDDIEAEDDTEDYWSTMWEQWQANGYDPDDARDRQIEDERWNGVD